MNRFASRIVLLLFIACCPFSSPNAKQRVVRLIDERDGLTITNILHVVQDQEGFVWIGTVGGLDRYDGRNIRPWARETVRGEINILTVGANGQMLVGVRQGPIFRVTSEGAHQLSGPRGEPLLGAHGGAIDDQGNPWVSYPDSLLWRTSDNIWHRISATEIGDDRIYAVLSLPSGGILVSTDQALYTIDHGGNIKAFLPIAWVAYSAVQDNGALVLLTADGRLFLHHYGKTENLFSGENYGRGLAVRFDTIFASIDDRVLSIRRGEPPGTVAPQPGIDTGRPLLVDHEGGLWVGTFNGILYFGEPGTVIYNHHDGLPEPTHARFITQTNEGLWLSTWAGSALITPEDSVYRDHPFTTGMYAVDGKGRVWTMARDQIVCRSNGKDRIYPAPNSILMYGHDLRKDGTLWMGGIGGLFLSPSEYGPPRHPPCRPPPTAGKKWQDVRIDAVLEYEGTDLYIAGDEEICVASVTSVFTPGFEDWECWTIPGAIHVRDLYSMPGGEVWAATENSGIWYRRGESWGPIPGNDSLPSLHLYGLKDSPTGGVWILGSGFSWRIQMLPGEETGWEVIERLSSWTGVPSHSAEDLIETESGDLWLTGSAGLVHVPASARRNSKPPPRVTLTEVIVDGSRRSFQEPVIVPHTSQIELNFAALSFRDPNLLQYQIRTDEMADWRNTLGPVIHFVDLSPGTYRAEMRASLDGTNWSVESAVLSFLVLGPWYRQSWAAGIFAVLTLALIYLTYRLRLAYLMRLERQRGRIAMDLHDDMGSGLGSIGILAGLARNTELSERHRQSLVERIAEQTKDLGSSLSDIVWSLRPGPQSLATLADYLTERGSQLFAGEDVDFSSILPTRWPHQKLPLEMSRGLQLIAVEGLHNASRHSSAQNVTLGMEGSGRCWKMWIEDDGEGIKPEVLNGETGGLGLSSMRRRAEGIGVQISIEAGAAGGTRVEVEFSV